MQHDPADDFFIALMRPIVEPLMTPELAQQEANADHFTEQQEMMMGVFYEGI